MSTRYVKRIKTHVLFCISGSAFLLSSCAPMSTQNVPLSINIKKNQNALIKAQEFSDEAMPIDPSEVCFFINVTGAGIANAITPKSGDSETCSNSFRGIGITSPLTPVGGEVALNVPIGPKTIDLLAYAKADFGGSCPAGSFKIREDSNENPVVFFNDIPASSIVADYEPGEPAFFGRAEVNVLGGGSSSVDINVETNGSEWNAYPLGCDRGGGDSYPRIAYQNLIGPMIYQYSTGNQTILVDTANSNFDSCSLLYVWDGGGADRSDNFGLDASAGNCNILINDTSPSPLADGTYHAQLVIEKNGIINYQRLVILRGTPSLPTLFISKYKFGGETTAKPVIGRDIRKEQVLFNQGNANQLELILEIKNLSSTTLSTPGTLNAMLSPYGMEATRPYAYNGFQWGNASTASAPGGYPGASTSIPNAMNFGFSTDTVCDINNFGANSSCLLKLYITNNPGEHHMNFKPNCGSCVDVPDVSIAYSVGDYNSGLGNLIIEVPADADIPSFTADSRFMGSDIEILDMLTLLASYANLQLNSYPATLTLSNIGDSKIQLPSIDAAVTDPTSQFVTSTAVGAIPNCVSGDYLEKDEQCRIRYVVDQAPIANQKRDTLVYKVYDSSGSAVRYQSEVSLGLFIQNFYAP